MPAKKQITKKAVLDAAFALIREHGMGAINAREVAKRLGCSTQPIYLSFCNMEELKAELTRKAEALYQSVLTEDMSSQAYPPYKASGMAYIRFAKEEKELFKLLFMRDRSEEELPREDHSIDGLIALIRKNTGLDDADARLFHLEMWVSVHGIASMTATGYLELDRELTSRMLTDIYQGLLKHYQENTRKEQP